MVSDFKEAPCHLDGRPGQDHFSGPLREQFFAVAAGLPFRMFKAGIRGLQGSHGGERSLDCGFQESTAVCPQGPGSQLVAHKKLEEFCAAGRCKRADSGEGKTVDRQWVRYSGNL